MKRTEFRTIDQQSTWYGLSRDPWLSRLFCEMEFQQGSLHLESIQPRALDLKLMRLELGKLGGRRLRHSSVHQPQSVWLLRASICGKSMRTPGTRKARCTYQYSACTQVSRLSRRDEGRCDNHNAGQDHDTRPVYLVPPETLAKGGRQVRSHVRRGGLWRLG